jgi:hypothetical protein
MRFSGHETFACRYAWLPKALRAITANPQIFSDEDQAMVELGVGKNMVRSMKFWVDATGMAASREAGGLEPTMTGRRIFLNRGHDPFLEDITTLWLLHWNLCSHPVPLLAWDFLFNRWQEPEFTQSSAVAALRREVERHDRSASEVTLEQHLQVFLHSYMPTSGRKSEVSEDTLDCPLTELELLLRIGDRVADGQRSREAVYAFRRDNKSTISPGLFAYTVNAFWERRFPNEKTLSARTLGSGSGSPGQIFKIPEQDLLTRLQELEGSTDGAIRYSDSEALPQLHRPRAIAAEELLTTAYA